MGSWNLTFGNTSSNNSIEPDRLSEPEEYVLDTYTLPVDSEFADLQEPEALPYKNGGVGEFSKKFVKKPSSNPKNKGNRKSLPEDFVFNKKVPEELWGDGSKSSSCAGSNSLCLPKTSAGKKRPEQEGEDSTSKQTSDPVEPTAVRGCTGILHNDPFVCSCCACHVLIKKGLERRNRARQPRSGLIGATMGDLDGLGVGKSRSGRRSGHQLPFLKTVSIIDTLSELGPEVRHLAEEPRPPPPTKSNTNNGNSKATKAPPSRSNIPSEAKEISHPLGLPVVSEDFQQYTEKIYDAVTRHQPDSSSSSSSAAAAAASRIKNQRTRFLPSSVHSERLKKPPNYRDFKEENGFKVKSEEENAVRINRQFEHRGRERGRTPDWIKRIFDIAKNGDLEELKQGIADMEETLVRNLSDHAGNNLLHVMAVFGHLAPMVWMLTTHSVLVDALQDENKYGLTPLVCSIKYGRLHLVQWLVENTVVKDKVKCKDGERSLLHIAAKYAQVEIIAWLVGYMMTHEISLDNKDHHGNTALHLAARTGNSRLCSILLQHGADVTLKNDLGQKAWEVCVIRGHLACAEYLCVHESGLALATDLTRREAELEAAMADNHDLRINFKEVMSIARRLLREREEAVRELSRLHEQMVEAHDNILLLHAYSEDSNFASKDRTDGSSEHIGKRNHIDSVVNYVKNLHERWQSVQKTWFGSSLVNMKHKMLLVEEAWKKLRHRSHRTVATTHHPLDVFRGKLGAVRAQGGEGRLGDLPSLWSSEESIVSLFPFTDEEEIYEKEENYESLPSSTPMRGSNTSKNKYRNELPHDNHLTRNDPKSCFSDVSVIPENSFSEARHRNDDSLLDKKEVDTVLNRSNVTSVKSNTPKFGENPRPYWTDPNLSVSLNLINELSPGEQLPKEEISARLKELALTSESGSCSVLEVIEPSSEESDNHAEDDKRAEAMLNCSNPDESSGELKSRNVPDRRAKRLSRNRIEEADTNGRGEATTSSESGVDYVHSSDQLHSNDTISHVGSEGRHFLVNETSVGTAAVDVSEKEQRPKEIIETREQFLTANATSPAVSSSAIANFKRKGFLHKLIKPPRWPSKRKVKTIRKLDPGNTRDLLDPFALRGGSRTANYSTADLDPQTTPESNTSSSQEYSNSSEESSIGKPTSAPSSRPTEPLQSFTGHNDSESRSIVSFNATHDVDKKSEKITTHMHPLSKISAPCSNSPPPLPSRRAILSPTPSDASIMAQGYHSDERSIAVKNMDSIQKSSITEVRSVATSEDSGIVARPASSASKSDNSASRPESSSSSFPPFKSDYALQKSNLSLTQDMLPTPDSSTAGRMSPAPSEVSKTESALSPPSHASDVSKSESSRQTSMGKGSLGSSTNSNISKDGSAASSDYSVTLLPLKKELNVKTAAIINISCDQTGKKSLQDELSASPPEELSSSKKEKPWYELSDEESDILLPDRLTSKCVPRASSSEDETEIC